MPAIRQTVCPQCGGPLEAVRRSPESPLTPDQFDAVRPGDWYCFACPGNDRGRRDLCYWWTDELPFVHDYQI